MCGACMVLVDGRAVQSCDIPLSAAIGHRVTTVEGLAVDGGPSALQQAFIDEQAGQCGYCLGGILISGHGASRPRTRVPSRADIRRPR